MIIKLDFREKVIVVITGGRNGLGRALVSDFYLQISSLEAYLWLIDIFWRNTKKAR
jgi:hypothetical protein